MEIVLKDEIISGSLSEVLREVYEEDQNNSVSRYHTLLKLLPHIMQDQQCSKLIAIQIFNGFIEDYHSCSYRELISIENRR